MAVINQDFTMYQGEGRTVQFTLTDNDLAGNPPLNLAALTLKWGAVQANEDRFGTTLVIEKCSNLVGANAITVTDAANGQGEFTLNPADTESLSGTLRHQMAIENLGVPVLVLEGTITFLPRIVHTC